MLSLSTLIPALVAGLEPAAIAAVVARLHADLGPREGALIERLVVCESAALRRNA